jgi:hypothetical protein
MMTYRTVAQRALVLLLVLALGACNWDSGQDPGDQPASETAGVSLTITSPISTSSMDTTDPAVDIAGSASSENGVYQVAWENDQGKQGVANGTESWKIPNVDLALGENNITVTAEDTAGEKSTRRIKIKRESGQKGSVTLSWNPPTSRVDGSALTNLAGSKIYYGRMSGIYDYEIDIDSPGISTYVVEGLMSGEWFFALAAYDAEGLESERSNEVLREIG